MFKPKVATPDTPIDDLFNEMSAGKQQFLVVKDGDTTVGIATIEDFLEEIVGEIWDEYDVYDEDFIKLGGNYFSISPKMKVRDAFDRIGADIEIPADIQKKTLEAWLRTSIEDELCEDSGFTFGNFSIVAGEIEDMTLQSVIVRLCENEEDAKEELEK
ncbi:MAG: CBS domain-containing protein [Clostridia bacterium]|nr:CBS domain-containing protein [Clostridia bacterium]